MTIIAYVPALHRGYTEFFAKHPGKIYVLDNALAQVLYPKIERDLRAMPAASIVAALKALHKDAVVLNEATAQKISDKQIVMPDEDLSRLFVKKYLANQKVTFVPAHLRWDGWSSVKESPVPPDRVVSGEELDKEMIKRATDQAAKSPDWWRQVGAVIVREGKVLLAGCNRPSPRDGYKLNAYGDPRSNFDAGVSYELTTAEHAEAHLIGLAACKGTSLKDAVMYLTTFPCPTCAKLIATAGIKKVYYAEGYSLVDAEQTLRDAGIEIVLVK